MTASLVALLSPQPDSFLTSFDIGVRIIASIGDFFDYSGG